MHGSNHHWINNNSLMAFETYDINTRFANNVNVDIPRPNVETFRNSFMYQGAISWNSLPTHLKYAITHDSFKRIVQQDLIQQPS